jgi:hypothetical protein
MRKGRALRGIVAAGLAGGAIALAVSPGASGTTQASAEGDLRAEVQNLTAPDASETAAFYAQAIRAAEIAGDPTPTDMAMAVTTMEHATALVEHERSPATNTVIDPRTGQPWNDSAVFIVTMRGHFRLATVPVREGQEAPTGEVLTLLIDRQTERVVGIHLSDTGDNLGELGTHVTTWSNG